MDELKFSERAVETLEQIDRRFSLDDLLRFLAENGVEPPRMQPVGNGVYRPLEHEYRWGYLAPSMFTTYYRCARRLWIEVREGRLITAKELFWMLRGRTAEVLWREEHPGFQYEIELEDPEERVCGVIDAIRIEDSRVIVVEIKSGHRPSLGHKLQTMMYAKMVYKAVRSLGKTVEAYLVYRHGVRHIKVNRELLRRYRRRVEAAISHKLPPPPPPERRYCGECPWHSKCAELPKTDWDEWLLSIGDYPKDERCADCIYRSFCRAFKASTGKYPCESGQKTLPNVDPKLMEAVLKG